jgi:polyisoprenoid-binding protein YceI
MHCFHQRSLAIALVSLVAAGPATARGAEQLKFSNDCGDIKFVGSKDDGSHEGGFKKFAGEVKLVPDDPSASSIKLEINTGSLWSDHPKLTSHLKNADFFHIDKFPKATFSSTRVREAVEKDRKSAGNEKVTHVIHGKLTMLGVTKEIDLPVIVTLNETVLALRGVYTLDRMRFGMNYGKGKIHDKVKVTFALKIPRGAKLDQ